MFDALGALRACCCALEIGSDDPDLDEDADVDGESRSSLLCRCLASRAETPSPSDSDSSSDEPTTRRSRAVPSSDSLSSLTPDVALSSLLCRPDPSDGGSGDAETLEGPCSNRSGCRDRGSGFFESGTSTSRATCTLFKTPFRASLTGLEL